MRFDRKLVCKIGVNPNPIPDPTPNLQTCRPDPYNLIFLGFGCFCYNRSFTLKRSMRFCKKFPLFILLLGLTGCAQQPPAHPSAQWQEFAARDNAKSSERPLLYRALVPSSWMRKNPPPFESIADTTKAICEFYIQENGEEIRLTIHTFPILEDHDRIPPQAQIARWKRQLEDLDPLSVKIIPQSHGGFSGLYFEGQGALQNKPVRVIGWSMQLASVFARQLSLERHSLDTFKRADYTIKATGPPEMMDKHRSAIAGFAESFELIDELPSPI